MDKVLVISIMILITESSGLSDFWTKANKTLLLSQTRRDTQSPYITPTRDPILDNPAFLPLCGNGRIDTKADYNEYYKTHIPLSLTKQQILYGYTPEYLTDATMLHNITILADEECDDGNRQDLDGCSADCMHMDLWTSACEIAVDKNLQYEDMIWDPIKQTMVASAADGIYSLEMDSGASTMRAQLLAPKSFPATNIFIHENSYVMYSAADQSLWQLMMGETLVYKVMGFTIENGILNGYTDRAYRNEDGSFFLHDENKVLYLETLMSAAIMCSCPNSKKCTYVSSQERNHIYECDQFLDPLTGVPPIGYRNSVTVGPGVCLCNDKHEFTVNADQNSLLYETLRLSAVKTGFLKYNPYKMDVTVSPPEPQLIQFSYGYIYHPWGILLEYPVSTPRKLGTVGIIQPNFYSLGESSILRMLTGEDSCGANTICAFDTKVGYDLMQSNPLKDAINVTWGDILQGQIMSEASEHNILTLEGIRSAPGNRYWALVDINFTENYFKPITSNLTVLAFQTHPITHNVWALRRNRLVEISKTGVQAQLPNGKCLPIGLGLCQECQWAPSGLPCRPCSTVDKTSASWVAKCDNSKCSTSGRRLLSDNEQKICFIVWGNLTKIKAIWPNTVGDSNSCNVTVTTTDPIGEMKRIREKLMTLQDVQVLTQPHVVVSLDSIPWFLKPSGTSNNSISNSKNKQTDSTSSDRPNISIILIISIMLVVIVIIVTIFFMHKCKHSSKAQHRDRGSYSYHHFNDIPK